PRLSSSLLFPYTTLFRSKHFSRRDLIKAMGLVGLATQMPFLFAQTPPRKRLGVALVGLGSYAGGQLAPALQETQHCYLAGIVTRSEEHTSELQSRENLVC